MTDPDLRRPCADCSAQDDHCHGTLLVHPGDDPECTTGPGCDAREDRHPLVVPCEELRPACAC